MNNKIFILDSKKINDSELHKAKLSYDNHGAFIITNIFTHPQVEELRTFSKKLFLKNGDKRVRGIQELESNKDKVLLRKFFAEEKLLNILIKIFKKNNIFLLPPYHIAKNYLPHSFETEAMGWHRDCNGETNYKACVRLLKDKSYTFGKIGIYLQDNSEYGGAIDIVPGSNRDFFNLFPGYSFPYFAVKLITILQRSFMKIYKLPFVRSGLLRIINATTANINAGDIIIFDSRTIHKGTFASADIEKTMKFDHSNLQAELPEDKTKFVLYSHFGNQVGIKSYFIDRNKRYDKKEMDFWIKDQAALFGNNSFKNELAPSLKTLKSLIHN